MSEAGRIQGVSHFMRPPRPQGLGQIAPSASPSWWPCPYIPLQAFSKFWVLKMSDFTKSLPLLVMTIGCILFILQLAKRVNLL